MVISDNPTKQLDQFCDLLAWFGVALPRGQLKAGQLQTKQLIEAKQRIFTATVGNWGNINKSRVPSRNPN